MTRTLTILLLFAGIGRAADEPVEKEKDERKAQLHFMRTQAEKFALTRADADDKPLTLSNEAVLRYTNPERERGTSDGVTYLWLDGRRPIAVCSFSIRRPDDSASCEFTSFSETPLRCLREGGVVWTPAVPEKLRTPFDVATPSDSANRRLFRMKALARRFAATAYHPKTNETRNLRLLERPLYRYEDKDAGILDGCLFAYAVSNDPELLILVEAIQQKGEKPKWVYSIRQMTSWEQIVRLDGLRVWDCPNYYRSGNSPENPYLEMRIGNFVPGDSN